MAKTKRRYSHYLIPKDGRKQRQVPTTPTINKVIRRPFLESPETFRVCFWGDIILFVSSNRRRLEARNFTVISIFYPSTIQIWKNSFTEYVGRRYTNGFSGPKSFRDFLVTHPRTDTARRVSERGYVVAKPKSNLDRGIAFRNETGKRSIYLTCVSAFTSLTGLKETTYKRHKFSLRFFINLWVVFSTRPSFKKNALEGSFNF